MTLHPSSTCPDLHPADQRCVTPETFREVMRRHPAAVTVITLDGSDGPVGFTASSPSGVSVDPALISFNIGLSSSSLAAVLQADSAVVHLLRAGDEELAARFAGPAEHRFADPAVWVREPTGEPALTGERPRLRVGLDRIVPAGDHVLVLARVLDVWSTDDDRNPLVVLDGGLHTVPPTPA